MSLSQETIPTPGLDIKKKKIPNCYRYESIKDVVVTKQPILKISKNEEENIIKTEKINVIDSKDNNNIKNNEKDLNKNLIYQKNNHILTNSEIKILGSDFLPKNIDENENERLSKNYLIEDK